MPFFNPQKGLPPFDRHHARHLLHLANAWSPNILIRQLASPMGVNANTLLNGTSLQWRKEIKAMHHDTKEIIWSMDFSTSSTSVP
jgi:hypothetical protein